MGQFCSDDIPIIAQWHKGGLSGLKIASVTPKWDARINSRDDDHDCGKGDRLIADWHRVVGLAASGQWTAEAFKDKVVALDAFSDIFSTLNLVLHES